LGLPAKREIKYFSAVDVHERKSLPHDAPYYESCQVRAMRRAVFFLRGVLVFFPFLTIRGFQNVIPA
jgi:hypothetical protein